MNKIKEEKGSITLFVLVSMLFFTMYLVGMYMLSANGESSQIAESARIKEIYEEGVDNIDDVYNTMINNNLTKVNSPKLATGMTPIKWNGTQTIETTTQDIEWYNYADTSISGQAKTSKWANVKTKDGSMWVWIPRFAYKINYTDASNKSKGGTIDIVFLKGTTNNDFNGYDVTNTNYIDESGKIGAYIVHPAFKDGTNNNFANGEWRKEIQGIWVAKFEAGYEEASKAQDSGVTHSSIFAWDGLTNADISTNYYGVRSVGSSIKYPVFKANRPSMNYLCTGDIYKLARNLSLNGNPYGLENTDSHMMKNSEWGAVAYLTHSKYGINGVQLSVNNVSVAGESTVWAITGYSSGSNTIGEDKSKNLTTLTSEGQDGNWTTSKGQTASSTGNIYGIYDLSGGAWEYTSGYIAVETNYETYGGELKGESNEYKTKYEYSGTGETGIANYSVNENTNKIGEAIWETSTGTTNTSSWNSNSFYFNYSMNPFSMRGGQWTDSTNAGIFAYSCYGGYGVCSVGFRAVLIGE